MRKALTVLLALALAVPSFATTNGTIAPFPKHTFFDNNGNPCVGCKVFSYTAGTSTKVNTYTDVGLSVPNTNPIVLDSAGRATIFLTPGLSYKFILSPSTDSDPPAAPLWTVDSVTAVPPGGTSTDQDVTGTAGENLSAGDVAFISDGSGGNTAGRWYKADADNTYSSTSAAQVGMAVSAISLGASGSIRLSGRITGLTSLTTGTLYYVSATGGALTAVAPTNARTVGVADSTTSFVISPWALIEASGTVPGFINLTTQTLGAGTKTIASAAITSTLTVGSTPNYKPGSDTALDAFASGSLRTLVDTTQHANSGTGNTTMTSITFPAGALATDKQVAKFTFGGSFAANANTKTITFVFGATTVTITNGGSNGGAWHCEVLVIRTGAATQKIVGFYTGRPGGLADATAFDTTAAETLSGAITVQTKSQSGTASSDILQDVFIPEVIG